MSVVEKGIDIFSLLKEYFEESTLPPFSNYLRGKGLKPEMTSFMNGWYKQATEEMAVFLRSNEELTFSLCADGTAPIQRSPTLSQCLRPLRMRQGRPLARRKNLLPLPTLPRP